MIGFEAGNIHCVLNFRYEGAMMDKARRLTALPPRGGPPVWKPLSFNNPHLFRYAGDLFGQDGAPGAGAAFRASVPLDAQAGMPGVDLPVRRPLLARLASPRDETQAESRLQTCALRLECVDLLFLPNQLGMATFRFSLAEKTPSDVAQSIQYAIRKWSPPDGRPPATQAHETTCRLSLSVAGADGEERAFDLCDAARALLAFVDGAPFVCYPAGRGSAAQFFIYADYLLDAAPDDASLDALCRSFSRSLSGDYSVREQAGEETYRPYDYLIWTYSQESVVCFRYQGGTRQSVSFVRNDLPSRLLLNYYYLILYLLYQRDSLLVWRQALHEESAVGAEAVDERWERSALALSEWKIRSSSQIVSLARNYQTLYERLYRIFWIEPLTRELEHNMRAMMDLASIRRMREERQADVARQARWQEEEANQKAARESLEARWHRIEMVMTVLFGVLTLSSFFSDLLTFLLAYLPERSAKHYALFGGGVTVFIAVPLTLVFIAGRRQRKGKRAARKREDDVRRDAAG